MIYRDFKGETISLLGFGAMRLPLLKDGSGEVDEDQVYRIVRYAIEHGINYFDTAYPYHNAKSEIILGNALRDFPRENYYLATKFPGHQIADSYYPEEIFEEQLNKCGVTYFDFYLLHNVYENSIHTYTDPKWGIIDYFIKQKQLGRIKHLGFSCHGLMNTLNAFLDQYGDVMEFCQLQINYLDWSLQDAKAKYEMLTNRGIPVWVMEPVRGGRLASLDEGARTRLRAVDADASDASWAFRWLFRLSNVKVILSGMSDMEQLIDNVNTFEQAKELSADEEQMLFDIAESMKDSVPCTACRYCCATCPRGLDIPTLLSLYNDMRFSLNFNVGMTIESLEPEKTPSACIRCGKCAKICPQKIDIPEAMQIFSGLLEQVPSWKELSRQREEAARKLREERKAENRKESLD